MQVLQRDSPCFARTRFRAATKVVRSCIVSLRGEVLKEHCDRLLRQAEAKVEKLTFAADGSPKGTEPLDPQ